MFSLGPIALLATGFLAARLPARVPGLLGLVLCHALLGAVAAVALALYVPRHLRENLRGRTRALRITGWSLFFLACVTVAAGVMLAINIVPAVIFALCWLTGYFVIRRNLYVGVMTGALATPVLMYTAPEPLVRSFMQVRCDAIAPFTFFVFILALQVFVRHLEPIRTMFDVDEKTPD